MANAEIKIAVKIELSLWSAIKLRIAGKGYFDVVRMAIDEQQKEDKKDRGDTL